MVKNLPATAGDMGLIVGLGRSPGEGNGNPLQYSRLENPMNRGALQATVHGVTENRGKAPAHPVSACDGPEPGAASRESRATERVEQVRHLQCKI